MRKRPFNKCRRSILIPLLLAAMAVSMTACQKNDQGAATGSTAASATESAAGSDQSAAPENEEQTAASSEAQAAESEGILEADGELEIDVPEGEETYGE